MMPIKLYKLEVKESMLRSAKAELYNYYEYSDARGFMVLAENEYRARRLAACTDDRGQTQEKVQQRVWLDPEMTTCEEIALDSERVIFGNIPTG